MIRRSAHAALIAALAASLFSAPALAQPEEKGAGQASEEDRAIARRHFMRGKELHAARKYREAAAAYLEAYEHFPSPAFIYNVAQVYRLAGDRKAALTHYRKYLELEPDGEGSNDAREFVASLEDALAGDDGGQPPSADDTPASQPIDPGAPGPGDDRVSTGSPGRGKKILGTTVGAVGVVAIGVAVGFGLRASSAASELSDYRGPWTPDQQQKYDDGQSAERTMAISAVIGGASLAAGAVLFYLGHRDARRAAASRRLQVGALATDDQALVLVGGAF